MCGMQKIKVYVWKIKKTHYQKQISQVREWLVTIFPFILNSKLIVKSILCHNSFRLMFV